MADRIRIFSNGDQYRTWQHNNCDRCVKRPTCPLEEAIASACVRDGTIAQDIATRLGMPDDDRGRWWCKELQTWGTPEPKPAAREMADAGAAELPGFGGES